MIRYETYSENRGLGRRREPHLGVASGQGAPSAVLGVALARTFGRPSEATFTPPEARLAPHPALDPYRHIHSNSRAHPIRRWVWGTVPASLQEAALGHPVAAGGASEQRRGAPAGLGGACQAMRRTTAGTALATSKAQASMEMTVALTGAMILLLGSVKVFLWLGERLVRRQQYYECTRVNAGDSEPGVWNDPASKIALKIFEPHVISPDPCGP